MIDVLNTGGGNDRIDLTVTEMDNWVEGQMTSVDMGAGSSDRLRIYDDAPNNLSTADNIDLQDLDNIFTNVEILDLRFASYTPPGSALNDLDISTSSFDNFTGTSGTGTLTIQINASLTDFDFFNFSGFSLQNQTMSGSDIDTQTWTDGGSRTVIIDDVTI